MKMQNIRIPVWLAKHLYGVAKRDHRSYPCGCTREKVAVCPSANAVKVLGGILREKGVHP